MITGLLELGERGEDLATALDAFGGLDLAQRVAHDGFIEGGLLLGERAEDLHLQLLGEILDDGAVGLETSQDEGRDELLELGGGSGVGGALDGIGELLAK